MEEVEWKKKCIKESIKKWRNIRRDILAKKSYDYILKYWEECGYCEMINADCGICPLFTEKHGPIPFCVDNRATDSIAIQALYHANYWNWKGALDHVDTLLKKMRRDLKNVEDGLLD